MSIQSFHENASKFFFFVSYILLRGPNTKFSFCRGSKKFKMSAIAGHCSTKFNIGLYREMPFKNVMSIQSFHENASKFFFFVSYILLRGPDLVFVIQTKNVKLVISDIKKLIIHKMSAIAGHCSTKFNIGLYREMPFKIFFSQTI
jgi:hypothetical protein